MKSKKWTQQEMDFLKENYPKHGTKHCLKFLKRSKGAIKIKVAKLNLKAIYITEKYSFDNFNKVVKNSCTISSIARKLGLSKSCGNMKTIKKYINKYKIDISHFDNKKDNYDKTLAISIRKRTRTLSEIMIKDSDYLNTSSLKNKLYKERLKKRKCELCGQEEIWKGKKMSLRLDHINGISNDNRIENLRIVCPNCDATLETFSRGNATLKRMKNKTDKKYFCECGNEKYKQSKCCIKCKYTKQRKVKIRPAYEQLIKDTNEKGFCAIGRKYNVSDNTIRNWLNDYKNNADLAQWSTAPDL